MGELTACPLGPPLPRPVRYGYCEECDAVRKSTHHCRLVAWSVAGALVALSGHFGGDAPRDAFGEGSQ